MQDFDRSLFWEGEAVVEQTIEPGKRGRVRFRGSHWYALCQQDITLPPGRLVSVVGHRNITLIVEPIYANRISSLR